MKNKNLMSEIATSRAVTMFFCYVALSLALRVYIMPFQKHQLEINRYFHIIEYCIIGIAAIAFIIAVLNYFKSKKSGLDFSQKIFTPFSYLLLSASAFVATVIIPLSHNRTLAFKYSFYAFAGITVAYMIYYLLDKALSIPALICTFYIVVFSYLDYMYSENVTFSDKINIPYFVFLAIFAVVIIGVAFLCLNLKKFNIDSIAVVILSLIAILALVFRCFIIRYVSIIAEILLVIAFVLLAINRRVGFLYKK